MVSWITSTSSVRPFRGAASSRPGGVHAPRDHLPADLLRPRRAGRPRGCGTPCARRPRTLARRREARSKHRPSAVPPTSLRARRTTRHRTKGAVRPPRGCGPRPSSSEGPRSHPLHPARRATMTAGRPRPPAHAGRGSCCRRARGSGSGRLEGTASMGRHGAPPPRPAVPTGRRLREVATTWAERVGLGLAAGGGTWGVLQWAGTSAGAAVLTAIAVAVAVPTAAWAAARLPGHHAPSPGGPGQDAPAGGEQTPQVPGRGGPAGPGNDAPGSSVPSRRGRH